MINRHNGNIIVLLVVNSRYERYVLAGCAIRRLVTLSDHVEDLVNEADRRCRACSTAERTATNIVIAPIAHAAPCSHCSLLTLPAPHSRSLLSSLLLPALFTPAPCSLRSCSLLLLPLLPARAAHSRACAPCSCSHCSLLALTLVLPSLAAPFRL